MNRILPDVWYDSVLTSSVTVDIFDLDDLGFSASIIGTLLLVITWINWFVSWLLKAFWNKKRN